MCMHISVYLCIYKNVYIYIFVLVDIGVCNADVVLSTTRCAAASPS